MSSMNPPAGATAITSPGDERTGPRRVRERGRRWLERGVRTWLLGWPAIAQLVIDAVLAVPYLVVFTLLVVAVVTLPIVFVGLPILLVVLGHAFVSAHVERTRLWALTGVYVAPPAPPPAGRPVWRRMLLDTRLYRSLAHSLAIAFWGLMVGVSMTALVSVALALAAVPLYAAALPDGQLAMPWGAQIGGVWWFLLVFVIGVTGLAIAPLLARGFVMVDILLARWLLGPGGREEVERLSERVETLTQTRVATVDSVETERQRIERDLHDGPQQRLVAIAMDLGMAREKMSHDPEGARELLDKAHAGSKDAIVEMRQVARGIHPPVLTDRGLDAALSALAARSPVPVDVHVDVPTRPSPTLEAIAYFCVSEALTNVAKHSRARSARVDVVTRDGWLGVHVSDNGAGGADPARGTGLHGLSDRVRSVDGTLEVTSPPGGPTVLEVRLPLRPGNPLPAASSDQNPRSPS